MDIGHRQDLCLAGGEPLVPSVSLALRAMAVAAGVVGDGFVSAARASVFVATERCRTAAFDCRKHLAMQPGEPRPVALDEPVAYSADDVSHLERWPVHFACFLRAGLALDTS